MKKIFTTISFLLVFFVAGYSQIKNKVEFGVNIGYNNSYITDNSSYNNSATLSGFNAGVSADYYFSYRWSIKVKAIYDQKGWSDGFFTYPDGTTTDGVNYKLNYITIPVMANWHFGRTKNWYLDFGPYVGILLNVDHNLGSIYNDDVNQSFNNTDFGISLGIGIKFPIADRTKLFIEAEGQGGISNIFSQTSDGSSFQNSRSSLNIGVNFE